MKLKRLFILVVLTGLASLGQAARANSVVLSENQYSFDSAGEFTAKTTSENFLDNYVPATILSGGFETFCIEADVLFQPGVSYRFTLSNTDSEGRELTEGAAFLYSQFALGTLAGYDYTKAAKRKKEAGELQSALWYLQGGQTGGHGFVFGGKGNQYYDLALSELGRDNILAPNNGLYGVEVLQLWDGANHACQNQLVMNPSIAQVPESSSLSLLATGLFGSFLVYRRQR